jgi:hypothetical protein
MRVESLDAGSPRSQWAGASPVGLARSNPKGLGMLALGSNQFKLTVSAASAVQGSDRIMTKPVCLVLGAGAGIGGNVAKRFARDGYHACLARRSDKAGLDRLVSEIEAEGGSASGYMINAVEEDSIERLVTDIEAQVGPIAVAVSGPGEHLTEGL